jgi:hypothetical protein
MADPVTWAAIFAAAGTTVAVAGALKQAQATEDAAKYNQDVAEQNAQIADAQGAAAVEGHRRDVQRQEGAAIAAYGASGVQLSEGSPVDVLAESARSSTLDELTIKYNYKLKALGYTSTARLEGMNASNAKTAGYFNAASTGITGYGNAIEKFG